MSGSNSIIDMSCRMQYGQDTPATVYQTLVDEHGCQDSSTPLSIAIELSAHVAIGFSKASVSSKPAILNSLVFGSIRRLDGAPLLVWRADSEVDADTGVSGELAPLQLPPACFQFELSDKVLSVKIHRKYLPVSKCHGDAPFVFTFILSPGNGCAPSLVVTSPFISASKEPRSVQVGPKPQPKRKRAPPSSKPVAAPLTENDKIIQAAFPAYLASQSDHGSVSSVSRAPAGAGGGHLAPPQGASTNVVSLTLADSPASAQPGATVKASGRRQAIAAASGDWDTGSKRRKTGAAKEVGHVSALPLSLPVPLPPASATTSDTASAPDMMPAVAMSLTPMLRSALPASSPPSLPWGLPLSLAMGSLPGPSPTLPWPGAAEAAGASLPMPALQLASDMEDMLGDMSGMEEDMMSWAYPSTAGSSSSSSSPGSGSHSPLSSSSSSPLSGYTSTEGKKARGCSFELDLAQLA